MGNIDQLINQIHNGKWEDIMPQIPNKEATKEK